jgi:hypothetical protein
MIATLHASMPGNPFARTLAECCLARAASEATPESSAALTLERAHARIAGTLSPVIGDAGFDAVFARGVRKSFAQHANLERAVAALTASEVGPPSAWLRTLDPAETHAVSVTVMTHLIELLSILIGDELTRRFMDDAMGPAVPETTVARCPANHGQPTETR